MMDGLLVAAAPYSKARRGAAAPRLKHEPLHIFDTTSSSIKWQENGLIGVSHGRYNLSNNKDQPMSQNNLPEKSVHQKRKPWLLAGVCISGIVIAGMWFLYTPDGVLAKMDAVGYAVCHRIPSHSFMINGQPMPLCARCSGMYLGVLLGMVIQFTRGKRWGGFSRKWLIALSLLAVLFVVDGMNSFGGLVLGWDLLYPAQNWLRVITGLGVGLLISALIYPIFTQTSWNIWNQEAALDGIGPALAVVIGSVLLVVGLISGSPLILYALAILSVIGVVVILTMIYTVMLLMLFKQENRYNYFREMAPVLMSGMVLAMVQIGLFDLVRFFLTQTWSGLSL
jgi:uncharacterized membrane protein